MKLVYSTAIFVSRQDSHRPIGQYLAMVAATDDPTTPEKDGFTPGNPIATACGLFDSE